MPSLPTTDNENALSVSAHADRTGRCVGFDVADADVPPADALLDGDAEAFATERDLGLPGRLGTDLDVCPGNPAAPARSNYLQDGFLCGESAGEVLEVPFGVAGAVRLLDRR